MATFLCPGSGFVARRHRRSYGWLHCRWKSRGLRSRADRRGVPCTQSARQSRRQAGDRSGGIATTHEHVRDDLDLTVTDGPCDGDGSRRRLAESLHLGLVADCLRQPQRLGRLGLRQADRPALVGFRLARETYEGGLALGSGTPRNCTGLLDVDVDVRLGKVLLHVGRAAYTLEVHSYGLSALLLL